MQFVIQYRRGQVWLDDDCNPVLLLGEFQDSRVIPVKMIELVWLEPGAALNGWSVTVPSTSGNGLDVNMHIDCRKIMHTSERFEVQMGMVSHEVLSGIDFTQRRIVQAQHSALKENKYSVRSATKYDYDVALSFSGKDREMARMLAEECIHRRLRVFYDEYEQADLWGKDLVSHLDGVYRQRAKYCIILVSTNYASNIWTSHELKSALSRSLIENEEYLLPIRLDGTELPGLRPTTAYLRLTGPDDIPRMVGHVIAKLGKRHLSTYAEFSPKWLENVVDINQKWGLNCLAFCVDPRFALGPNGDELRVGISYGINLTSPRVGFLEPTEQSGKNVFGLHSVGVRDGVKLCLWDSWLDSIRADDFVSLEEAVRVGYQHLAAIDDSRYFELADDGETLSELEVSRRYWLDEFEISVE